MNILEIINKKVHNKKITQEEFDFAINSYISGEIKDYQMSSFLMSILLNGLDKKETYFLTKSFVESGEVLDLSSIKGPKVDKHSTGGVGDKVTLIIGPILAALGINVAKMSGKGLGHTGGTIDKLESIPGFTTVLSDQEFISQIQRTHLSIIGQSKNLVPADKQIYALRDVTGTVDSIELIASSIMSKKIATGADAILIDVKCGNGAFMKDLKSARALATELIEVGKKFKKNVHIHISNMFSPLGKMIGNKNEVLEAIQTLKLQGPKDLEEICVASCVELMMLVNKKLTEKVATEKVLEVLKNNKALEKFYELVENQGGDLELLKSNKFWTPKYKLEIKAKEEGFLQTTSALILGEVAVKLGAGRMFKEQKLDYEAGIELKKQNNDFVKKNEVLFVLYSSNPIDEKLKDELEKSYVIRQKPKKQKLILERLG
ncbi:thymidine phosphorylase [Mesomycoplasma hyorhinis]|uniref:Thymidine phosphorylase n=1 Tax=Mesomycoplasma hyorhinis (strain MCLD) TaxID=936139 RepID=A0ABM5M665_MESHM|nr:Thymidine phosphorylase [Mesomycoplasma hyorhinis MCLD]AEX14345.1 pyrimidine-nucleoside phosphorylase [Mesomycoplasma hyorhinis GDL-1]AHA41363.1 pyrimidine-nucleoside phosphorylase [Mesomycoplasma hyorhinis DBS 1050]VEU58112.1 Pyrimidine-nucleoside phosphorylase [Mesomycoplasma hyorhinis]